MSDITSEEITIKAKQALIDRARALDADIARRKKAHAAGITHVNALTDDGSIQMTAGAVLNAAMTELEGMIAAAEAERVDIFKQGIS